MTRLLNNNIETYISPRPSPARDMSAIIRKHCSVGLTHRLLYRRHYDNTFTEIALPLRKGRLFHLLQQEGVRFNLQHSTLMDYPFLGKWRTSSRGNVRLPKSYRKFHEKPWNLLFRFFRKNKKYTTNETGCSGSRERIKILFQKDT